jgi:hypothetical protein
MKQRRTKRAATTQELKCKALRRFGNKCACCNENYPEFLTFDHIEGGGHKHRMTFTSTNTYYKWLIESPEAPTIVQILCMNCNWARRYGTCPHIREEFYDTRDMPESPKESSEISKKIAESKGNRSLAKLLDSSSPGVIPETKPAESSEKPLSTE